MVIIEILDVIFTIISIVKPIIIIGLIIAIVIKATKSSGNNKYPKPNGYNNQYNQPYNMNQNGYNVNQPYNMNQNGYNANQYNQPYNTNQKISYQVDYSANNNVNDNVNTGHDHAYEHKVAPIVEASVLDKYEERKEAYFDRKQQMREDLPKTSYSKMEEFNSKSSYELNVNAQVGKSSNSVLQMNNEQEKIACKNCGAENIVPASRSIAYSCYFCKETL